MGPTTADPAADQIREAWCELVGEAGPPEPLDAMRVTGSGGRLRSALPVEAVAVACVGSALLAARQLHSQRGGSADEVTVDRDHVAVALTSERVFRRGGEQAVAGAGFAPLSRFWRTADGWVRTHANYPWHRDALLRVLGTTEDAAEVEAALAERRAEEVEADVFAAGGVAGALRSLPAWRAHPQGQALAVESLIGHHIAGDAAPRHRGPGELPASGIRVLDLTRVIAGPVCTRYLAALGAEVLRLDPPAHRDMAQGQVADTLLGKRSALLDLASPTGEDVLHRLLDSADVAVCGYRPGALERFGLAEEALAERHPGVVAVYLDAWGHTGPWATRRGFDSIVQAPTGIAAVESLAEGEPGALPCQLLDHGTGYLAAAAALDGLRRQAEQGGTHVRRLSLARTAWWLTSTPTLAAGVGVDVGATSEQAFLVQLGSTRGPVTVVAPPGELGTTPLRWPMPVTGYGTGDPTWSPTAHRTDVALSGGVANAGAVIRRGHHVLRPSNQHTPTIHRFLGHLHTMGFDGASVPIGVDTDGRERLHYIEGEVPIVPYPDWAQADDTLTSIARLIRRFHDAASTYAPGAEDRWSDEMADPDAGPVICHNDVCLENVVFRDGTAVALLDFDFAAPGRPLYDLACFARMCVPIDDDSRVRFGWHPAPLPTRLRLVADSYGLDADERSKLVAILSESIAHGGEFLLRRVRAGDPNFIEMWSSMGGMARFDRRRAWWSEARHEFDAAMR